MSSPMPTGDNVGSSLDRLMAIQVARITRRRRHGRDKDLDPLREREDFKALIQELETKAVEKNPAEKRGEKNE
jgi:hypothetical protein